GCEMPLTIPEAGTRSATQTLLKVIRQTGEQNPAARLVVILPEIAPRHLWDIFLRNRTILLLKLILLFQPNRIVVSVPYHEHEDAENGAPHGHSHTNIIIVPVARVDRAVARSLNFARTIAGNVTAVFVHYEAAEAESLLAAWKAARFDVPLQLIESPYRSVTGPLLKYINIVSQEHQDDHIVVVLPEIVPRLRRHLVLHNQTTALLKLILLLRPRNRIVISMPFHLER
ncbi:MAG: hypothetical protein HYR71_08690, partial [Chloroflexi bacterium]|nr:hypothetical protein [Chloroflexota bacterium]